MSGRFLCDDCKWSWRSCTYNHKGYPNVRECFDYESRVTGERYVSPIRASTSPDSIDNTGKIWRDDRYWDNLRGWRKPNLFLRLVRFLQGVRQ